MRINKRYGYANRRPEPIANFASSYKKPPILKRILCKFPPLKFHEIISLFFLSGTLIALTYAQL